MKHVKKISLSIVLFLLIARAFDTLANDNIEFITVNAKILSYRIKGYHEDGENYFRNADVCVAEIIHPQSFNNIKIYIIVNGRDNNAYVFNKIGSIVKLSFNKTMLLIADRMGDTSISLSFPNGVKVVDE